MPSKDNIKSFESSKKSSSAGTKSGTSKKSTSAKKTTAKTVSYEKAKAEIDERRRIEKLQDEEAQRLARKAKKDRQKQEKEKEDLKKEIKKQKEREAKELEKEKKDKEKETKKAEKAARRAERKQNRMDGNPEPLSETVVDEVIGILFIGIGFFLFMCLFNISTGILGDIVKQVLMGLLGYLAYIIPAVIIIGGVISMVGRNVKIFRIFICLIAVCMLAAWLQLFPYEAGKFQDESLMGFLKSTYNKGLDSVGTGVLFSVVTYGAKALLGMAGAKLILILLFISAVLLLLNQSVTKLTKRAIEKFREKSDERKAKEHELARSDLKTINNRQTTAKPAYSSATQKKKVIVSDDGEGYQRPKTSKAYQTSYSEPPLVRSAEKTTSYSQQTEENYSAPERNSSIPFRKNTIGESAPEEEYYNQDASYQDADNYEDYQEFENSETYQDIPEDNYPEDNAPAEKPSEKHSKKSNSRIIPFFSKKKNVEDDTSSDDEEETRPTITEMAEITGEKRELNVTVDGEILDDGTEASIAAPVLEKKPEVQYIFPSLDLLETPVNNDVDPVDEEEVYAKARAIEQTLSDFGIGGKVNNVTHGPVITRYEYSVPSGTKMSRVTSLDKELAYSLECASIRIEAPIPNKAAIGIEVPNAKKTTVYMRELLESEEFKKKDSLLAFVVGKDIAGNIIIGDIAKMPHTLISGATGSGKSVFINSIILSILYKAAPSEVKLIMVDPKKVEFEKYRGIPHLMFPVVSNPKRAAGVLAWAVKEMEDRYEKMAKVGVRDLRNYNKLMKQDPSDDPDLQPLPLIVIIIDELSDLMVVAGDEVEDSIYRLAQMARAAGMYLIIATQRPSVDVITGVIKANIPSRIALKVASQHDSRTILDTIGAEQLLGNGDMIYKPAGLDRSLRVQGAWVSDDEIENVVEFIRSQNIAPTEIVEESLEEKISEIDKKFVDAANTDDLLEEAIAFVVKEQEASVSMLQRRFRIGHGRAGNLIDEMEKRGVVGPHLGSKPREVLLTMDELEAGFTPDDKY